MKAIYLHKLNRGGTIFATLRTANLINGKWITTGHNMGMAFYNSMSSMLRLGTKAKKHVDEDGYILINKSEVGLCDGV
jgi:hypothetical protein